jgi:transcriptional regulator with XRE-family HTH domain
VNNVARDLGPTLRRRELGSRLRELRLAKELTAEDVATQLLCSVPKISRIETGGRGVSLRDVRDLCGIYGVDAAERDHLMSLARESKQRAWWQDFDVPYQTFIGLETAAVSISDFEPGVVPGLLQTEAYARALTEGMVPTLSADRVQQAVETRLIRQKLLEREDPPRYWVVLDESALQRHVGGPGVMGDQLEFLAERALLPNVTIQLIPFEAGAHPGIDSTFIMLAFEDPGVSDVVYVEGLLGRFYVEREADVKRYRRAFDDLRAIALGPKDTLARLQQIGTSYRQ